MPLPVIPSVGVQLEDLSSFPQYAADAGTSHAAGAGPPSDGQHGPAAASVAANIGDSTSFDTDTGSYAGTGGGVAAGVKGGAFAAHPAKHLNPLQVAFARQHQPRGLWARLKEACIPPRPVVAAAAAPDGEASMYVPPSAADVARHWAATAWTGLKSARRWAFDAPAKSLSGHGVLYSLVSRQLPVDLPAYEAYAQELLDREAEGRAAPRRSVFLLPMLHPHCGAALGWAGAMLCFDLVYTAFWVPVNTAFCLQQYGDLDASCTQVDLAGGVIYILNLLLGFQVGLTLAAGYRSRVVTDGRDTAALYVRTWTFWVDLLAIAPFIYLLVLIRMDDSVSSNQTVSIISLMRLVRLFRVASIISTFYTHSVGSELQPSWLADNVSITSVYMVLLCYVCALFVNLYSCILLLISHYESAAGRASWMDSIAWMSVAASSGARQWWSAVYFVVTIMTTTGFADFVPKSPMEQVLTNVVMLNGVLVFGAVVALIGNTIKRSQAEAQRVFDARKRLSHIRQWLGEGHVPEGTQRDVLTFFTELGAKRTGGRTEGDIVFELPAHLRQKVTRHVLLELLVQCPQLAGLPAEVRELMASHCVPIELPTGHELFRLGDEAGGAGLWLLEEGVVLAMRGQERAEAPAGPTGLLAPCLLGDAALLAELVPACGTRIWSLRTERPCRLWQLRGPALRAVQRLYPATSRLALAHVRTRLLGWLAGSAEEEEDELGWCEVVQLLKRSFLMGPLRERIHDCYLALQLAAVEDGSLVRLLGAWLDASVSRELAAGPDQPEPEDRTSQRFSLDVARATRAMDRTSRLLPGLAAPPHASHAPHRRTPSVGDMPTPAATPMSVLSPPTSGAVPTAAAAGDAAGAIFSQYGGSHYSALAYGGSGYGSVDGDGGAVSVTADGGGGAGAWVAVAAEGGELAEAMPRSAVSAASAAAVIGRTSPSLPAARRLAHQMSVRGVAGVPLRPLLPPVIERHSELAPDGLAFPRSSSATGLQQLQQQPQLQPSGSGELLQPAPPLSRAASGRWSAAGLAPVGVAGTGAEAGGAAEPLEAAIPRTLTPGEQAMMQLRAPGRARSSRFLSESGSVPYSFYRVASSRTSANPSASGHGRTAGLEAMAAAAAAAAAAGGGGRAGTVSGSPGGSLRGGNAAAAALAAAAASGSSARLGRLSSLSGRPGLGTTLPVVLPGRASAPARPASAAMAAARAAAATAAAGAAALPPERRSPPLVLSGSLSRTTPTKAAKAKAPQRRDGIADELGLPEPPGFGVAGGYNASDSVASAAASSTIVHSGGGDGVAFRDVPDLGRLLSGSLSGGGGRGHTNSTGGGTDGGGSGPLTPPPSPPRERDLVEPRAAGGGAGAGGERAVSGELRRRRVTDSGGVPVASGGGDAAAGPRRSLEKTSLASHQQQQQRHSDSGGVDTAWDALPRPPLLLARRGAASATGLALSQQQQQQQPHLPLPLPQPLGAQPQAHLPGTSNSGAAAAAAAAGGRGHRRMSSGGHTSFINKIFLAAGVPLPSPPPPEQPSAAAPGGGGAAATGLVIAGPACSTCGAATCAFCLRPILPAGALAAMQPVEQLEPATTATSSAAPGPALSRGAPAPPSAPTAPAGAEAPAGGGAAAVPTAAAAAAAGPSGSAVSSLGIKLLGERPLPPIPGLTAPARGNSNPASFGIVASGSGGLTSQASGSGQLRGVGGGGGGCGGPLGFAPPPPPPAPAALALARMRSLQPQRSGFAGMGRGAAGSGGSGAGSVTLTPAGSMRVASSTSGTAPRLTLAIPHAGSSGGGREPSPQPLTPGAALAAAAAAVSDTLPTADAAGEGAAATGAAAAAGAPGGGVDRHGSKRLGGTMDVI